MERKLLIAHDLLQGVSHIHFHKRSCLETRKPGYNICNVSIPLHTIDRSIFINEKPIHNAVTFQEDCLNLNETGSDKVF